MVFPHFNRRGSRHFLPFAWCMPVLLAACSSDAPPDDSGEEPAAAEAMGDGPLDGQVTVDRLPTPDDATLLKGRDVWAGTCMGCHGLGIAGSPKITDKTAWAPRIAKGKDTLYEHAINGFFGADGAMMPERGGNPELSDDEIRAAVDFMVANSQ